MLKLFVLLAIALSAQGVPPPEPDSEPKPDDSLPDPARPDPVERIYVDPDQAFTYDLFSYGLAIKPNSDLVFVASTADILTLTVQGLDGGDLQDIYKISFSTHSDKVSRKEKCLSESEIYSTLPFDQVTKVQGLQWRFTLTDDGQGNGGKFKTEIEDVDNLGTVLGTHVDTLMEACMVSFREKKDKLLVKFTIKSASYLEIVTASDPDNDDDDNDDDDYWNPPDANRECEPGQGFSESKSCRSCPPGTYNFPGSRVDTCFKCPFGEFNDDDGQHECNRCDGYGPTTTKHLGSDSSDACTDNDDIISNFARATVGLLVEVEGGDWCTDINELFWGISEIIPWDGRFTECTYEGDATKVTKIRLEVTPPAKYAWSVWEILNFVHAHIDVINAYAALGEHYANLLFEFLNSILEDPELSFIGIRFNPELLNLDYSILTFEPSFKGHCQYDAADTDIYCEDGPTDSVPKSCVHLYFELQVKGLGCRTNAGRTKIRNLLAKSSGFTVDWLNDGNCALALAHCIFNEDSEENLIIAYATVTPDVAEASLDKLIGVKLYDDGTVSVLIDAVTESCNDGAKVNDELNVVCTPCEEGHFVNDVGMCEPCPFTTWGSDGVHCNSCGWVYETPFCGMSDEDQCIQPSNWWDFEVHDYNYHHSEYLKEPAGELPFKLALIPTMNMCGVSNAKKSLDGSCQQMFTTDELYFPASASDLGMLFEDGWKLQNLICKISTNFAHGYNMLCQADDPSTEWDKPWDDIFSRLQEGDDEAILDLICYVGKRVYDLEEVDTSDNCASLDSTADNSHIMSMDVAFRAALDIYLVGPLVPLLTKMKNLETLNFASFADAEYAGMENLGLADINSFIGWEIADVVLDLVMAVPRGFSMDEFTFRTRYEKSSFFCDNDNVKRQCWDIECDVYNCRKPEHDEDVELECVFDECENCAVSYMHYDTDYEYECEDDDDGDGDGDGDGTCQFPDYISGGYKVWQDETDDGNEYAIYMCYPPFVMNPNKDMMFYLQEYEGYDVAQAYMAVYDVAYCDEEGVVYFPECVDHEEAGHCGLPAYIEHGSAVEFMLKDAEEDGAWEDEVGVKTTSQKLVRNEQLRQMFQKMPTKDGHDAREGGDEEEDHAGMPIAARYECEEGYVMHQTTRGNIGWCRMDGSMEIPWCHERDEYWNMKFKLDNGGVGKLEKDGRVFGGVVLAQMVDVVGNPMSDWEYGCNDGWNDYAAGAICRSLLFGSGAIIPVSKKMLNTEERHEFGWTQYSCKYDDTFVMSYHCEAMRYDEVLSKMGVKAACFDFDIAAVKCFESAFEIDVTITYSKKKITCNAQLSKEDNRIDLGDLGVEVKFLLDGTEIETGDVKYKVKKGFFAKVDLRDKKFECACCEIYADGNLLGSDEVCKDD